MNKIILIGRFTTDPEVRVSNSGENPTTVAHFTLAVDRKKKTEGQPTADFPSCAAFGKTAEFIEKYFKKGQKIAVTGRLQTGSYTNKDGVKVYTTTVMVEEAEFVESKGSTQEAQPTTDANGFMNIPDNIDEDLPFN